MNRLSHLSQDITSYDLLKSFAVILMLVDHIGYYFFDGEQEWRLLGRLCVPVWFFLIGYARSRDIGVKMWVGMAVLMLASGVTGSGFLPLNILGTMLVIRLTLDAIMARVVPSLTQPGEHALWQMGVFLVLLSFPSAYLFEYGTLAIVMAMFGWLVRHQHEYPQGGRMTQYFFFFAYGVFVVVQTVFFGFKDNEILLLAAGILAVMTGLMFFRPLSFAGTGQGLRGWLLAPVRFMGRWTLEIYVVHLLAFKALGALYFPERFPLFNWQLFPRAMVEMGTAGG
ncbi:MAG TPA: TraX family protein [Micavibrio sp.]